MTDNKVPVEQADEADVAIDHWHKPAHRAVMASVKLGAWMSAALDDPAVCDAMKADIREWFSAGEPMETLNQALAAALTQPRDSEAEQMREALEWYAERVQNCRKIGSIPEGVEARAELSADGGERAIRALAGETT